MQKRRKREGCLKRYGGWLWATFWILVYLVFLGLFLWWLFDSDDHHHHHHHHNKHHSKSRTPTRKPTRSPSPSRATNTPSNSPSPSASASRQPSASPSTSPQPPPAINGTVRVVNAILQTLWIEARYGDLGLPLPGYDVTSTRLYSGEHVDYTIPEGGLAGARFWAKWGCDEDSLLGTNCIMGQSVDYYPPTTPPSCGAFCAPPSDSLFEVTFGCQFANVSLCTINPSNGLPLGSETFYDTSQADGWTLPYTLEVFGNTSFCDCNATTGVCAGAQTIDGRLLDVSQCPVHEDLSMGGMFPSVVNPCNSSQVIDLSDVDLRLIAYNLTNANLTGSGATNPSNATVACMSPCKKLNFGCSSPPTYLSPIGLMQNISLPPTLFMCCPTPCQPNTGCPDAPDSCLVENGCVTSAECRAGPAPTTDYVTTVHALTNSTVYAYAYDDTVGLHACPSLDVRYVMTFGPGNTGTVYPRYDL